MSSRVGPMEMLRASLNASSAKRYSLSKGPAESTKGSGFFENILSTEIILP